MITLGFAVVVSVVIKCVRADLAVLYNFESSDQLRQTLKPEACLVTEFVQDEKDYIGILINPNRIGWLVSGTLFFHQASPYYIFNRNGQKVDFSRNHNDDHAFIHRWPELFPAIKSCECGLKK